MVFDENPDHIMEGDSETDAAQVILPTSRSIVQGIYNIMFLRLYQS